MPVVVRWYPPGSALSTGTITQTTLEDLSKLIERRPFRNPDDGFCVQRVDVRHRRGFGTVFNHAAFIAADEWVRSRANGRGSGGAQEADDPAPGGQVRRCVGSGSGLNKWPIGLPNRERRGKSSGRQDTEKSSAGMCAQNPLTSLSSWVDEMLIVAVHDPSLPVTECQNGIGQRQPGCDQRGILRNVMRREDEGNQAQAREVRQADLVAVPIRAPGGNADLQTSNDASRRDVAIYRLVFGYKVLDDPVGVTTAHLVEQVEGVAALM
jgi:hypothetical protein